MIAESAGLIGTSLNVSPVGGRPLFSFPEVKNTVRFTTEPAHMRMQTVSVGVVTKQPESACSAFLRPMKDNLMPAHVHTLVPLYTLEKELPDTR